MSFRADAHSFQNVSSARRNPDFAVSIQGNSSMNTIFRRWALFATTSRKA